MRTAKLKKQQLYLPLRTPKNPEFSGNFGDKSGYSEPAAEALQGSQETRDLIQEFDKVFNEIIPLITYLEASVEG
jgi:hypothetical protein